MHLRNSPSIPRTSGRLAQFKPTSVPCSKQLPSVWNRSSGGPANGRPNNRRSKSLDLRPKSAAQQKASKVVHFASKPNEDIDNPKEEETLEEYLISRKPSAIYRYNSIQFLNSLRNFRHHTTTVQQTTLSRHYKMSKDILDSFVRLKTAQIEGLFGERRTKPMNGFTEPPNHTDKAAVDVESDSTLAKINANLHTPPSTVIINEMKESSSGKKQSPTATTPAVSLFRKKNIVRPKSASIHSRRSRLLSSSSSSKSTPKLHKIGTTSASDINSDEEPHFNGENGANDDDIESMEPFYHRSLDKISSIANWERQIRYELEIEKELQRRELDRQKEKIQNDQRKLEEWDKQLRIELDARERKMRLSEEELRSRYEEFSQKSGELMRREQMINEIVTERIKAEMKFEIEKLRKKFNELELDKTNLTKKEERVKEVEARLHEQVKIVKEKIDSKRLTDIEMAKYKKELEIVQKENEVLREKVESMEDYQVTKFENRAMKSELQILKESLDSKNQELERERERWEKEQRANDQKVVTLRGELRKTEQELVIQKQKAEGDLEEMTSKYDAVNGQLKRLQAFIKDHLVKLNSDFSSAAQSLNAHYKPTAQGSFWSPKTSPSMHLRQHSSSLHLHRMGRGTGQAHGSNRFNHQRSVSMDGHDYMAARAAKSWAPFHRSPARGCRLCNDEEECELENEVIDEDGYLLDASGHQRNSVLIDYGDIEEEAPEKESNCCKDKEHKHPTRHQHELKTNTSPKSNGIVLHELLEHSYPPQVDPSPVITTIREAQLNNNSQSPVRGLKSILPLENDDLDADSNDELPDYHESIRIDAQPTTQHRSLFEEMLASESVAGSSSSFNVPPLSGVSKLVNAQNAGHSQSSVENDDNNNHLLSKKTPSGEQIPSNSQMTVTAKEKALSRSNSAGDSRSDSKSESFEIDW